MDYTLQLHGERTVYFMPPGLAGLMSHISREVLRDQPTQIYEYIANMLETMVKVRGYSRIAGQLVDDVIGENMELLAYVQSLGVSWEEVNQAARRIQRAFRMLKCRRDLKRIKEEAREKIYLKTKSQVSVSFQEFLKVEGIDFKSLSRGSSLIGDAYRSFKAKQLKLQEEPLKHASTNTIDTFVPKIVVPFPAKKRDPKMLTYQESPIPSSASGWASMCSNRIQEKTVGKVSFEKSVKEFVYEQEPLQSELYSKYQLFTDPTASPRGFSSASPLPEEELGLPSYYNDTNGHIPMMTQSGQLIKDENEGTEIVTLYSGDSESDDKISLSQVTLPSTLSDMTPQTKERMADELFHIIERRNSNASLSSLSSNSFTKESERIRDHVYTEVLDPVNKDITSLKKNVSETASTSQGKQSKLSGQKK